MYYARSTEDHFNENQKVCSMNLALCNVLFFLQLTLIAHLSNRLECLKMFGDLIDIVFLILSITKVNVYSLIINKTIFQDIQRTIIFTIDYR